MMTNHKLKTLEDFYGFWAGKTSIVKDTVLLVFEWETKLFPTAYDDQQETRDGLTFLKMSGDSHFGWLSEDTLKNNFRKL